MKRVTIHVAAEDIALGVRGSWDSCPVSRALHAHGFLDAGTGTTGLWLDSECPRILLPDDAYEFVRRLDEGSDVEPFTFRITLPDDLAASYRERP